MSAVHSAKKICELALRAINAFPVTESSADPEQLRETMTWLDMIMAEFVGSTRVLSFVPQQPEIFALTNGVGSYDLNQALSADQPLEEMQFPVEAYVFRPQGQSVIALGAAIPAGIAIGQSVINLSNPGAIPPGSVVLTLNPSAQQFGLTTPSMCATGDVLQFGTPTTPTDVTVAGVAGGTINGPGMIAGTSTFTRHPVRLLPRDEFSATHRPDHSGWPRICYIDRTSQPTLQIFPTPLATDPQMHVFGLDLQTYAPNVAPQGVNGAIPQASLMTNFRQAWQRWLVFQLASDIGSGPVVKIADNSIKVFQAKADTAKLALLAFENREHDDTPPVGEAFDDHEYHHGGSYHREYGWR